jgi:TetR/AcrR family transcriptional regulator
MTRTPTPAQEAARLARKARRQADRRGDVVAAARRILAEHGPEAFSIGAVAEAAGLARTSVLYYFADLRALVGEVVVQLLQEEADVLCAAVDAATDDLDAPVALLRAKVALYADDPGRFRTLYVWPLVLGLPDEVVTVRAVQIGNRVNDRLEARLEAARQAGRLAPDAHPRRVANLAWVTANGVLGFVQSFARLGGDTRFPLAQLTEEAAGVLARGIRG